MRGPHRPAESSIAIFLFGLLAFSPPILAVFGASFFVFDLPLLYLYLFCVWGLVIGFVGWIADFGGRGVTGESENRRRRDAGSR